MSFLRKKPRRPQGQIISEYAIAIIVFVSVVIAMSLYVRRVLQARIRDATVTMWETAKDAYNGEIFLQYEPYYSFTNAKVERGTWQQINMGKEGFHVAVYNDVSHVNSVSEQWAPVEEY